MPIVHRRRLHVDSGDGDDLTPGRWIVLVARGQFLTLPIWSLVLMLSGRGRLGVWLFAAWLTVVLLLSACLPGVQ